MVGKLAIYLTILVIISCSCLALNVEWDQEWVKFVKTHNKVYKNKIEELHRRSIWEDNMKKINEHNQNSKATFSMRMNQFGDLTGKEFAQKYFNKHKASRNDANLISVPVLEAKDLPASVDWREKGCVGPVINQGQCGSSWAFGVTSSLEGCICAKLGQLVTLSAQQLIDCSSSFGNLGCNGGQFTSSFSYIKQYGLELNNTYPYTASDGNCVYDPTKVVAKCQGAAVIKYGDEDGLTAAIANIGPVAVAVDASNPSFHFYWGGIYYEPNCNPDMSSHGAVAVGYGSNGTNLDYYIVKNEWGTGWGDQGFIYMSRNRQNNCGIATEATYPLL